MKSPHRPVPGAEPAGSAASEVVYSPSPPPGAALGPEFFARDTLAVARDLVGKILVRGGQKGYRWGRVVEVEAYLGATDLASHAAHGLTPRNRAMHGSPGRAYVYLVYGLHHCVNVVAHERGVPGAVLVRALEPGPGVGRCSGPGLVCRSLGIELGFDGAELAPPTLFLIADGSPAPTVVQTERIGVNYAGDWAHRPWRYCTPSPHLSRPLRDASPPGSVAPRPPASR